MHANSLTSPIPGGELNDALEAAKSRFLARNLDRCGYLRVVLEPADADDRVVIAATFTLDTVRHWHRVEAFIEGPQPDGDLDRSVSRVFETLEDGISTARIAHLFAPHSLASRMSAGRAI